MIRHHLHVKLSWWKDNNDLICAFFSIKKKSSKYRRRSSTQTQNNNVETLVFFVVVIFRCCCCQFFSRINFTIFGTFCAIRELKTKTLCDTITKSSNGVPLRVRARVCVCVKEEKIWTNKKNWIKNYVKQMLKCKLNAHQQSRYCMAFLVYTNFWRQSSNVRYASSKQMSKQNSMHMPRVCLWWQTHEKSERRTKLWSTHGLRYNNAQRQTHTHTYYLFVYIRWSSSFIVAHNECV